MLQNVADRTFNRFLQTSFLALKTKKRCSCFSPNSLKKD